MTDREDMPRVVAAIMWNSPGLVLRGGFAYLRMKRRAKRSARHFMSGLIRGGMSPEMARRLSDKYAVNLSIRAFIGGFGSSKGPPRERSSAGK